MTRPDCLTSVTLQTDPFLAFLRGFFREGLKTNIWNFPYCRKVVVVKSVFNAKKILYIIFSHKIQDLGRVSTKERELSQILGMGYQGVNKILRF